MTDAKLTRSVIWSDWDDLLAEDGPNRALRPKSIENTRVAIRHFASAVVEMGVPISEITSLSVLADPGNFKLGLRYFIDKNDGAPPTWLHGTAGKIVNRH